MPDPGRGWLEWRLLDAIKDHPDEWVDRLYLRDAVGTGADRVKTILFSLTAAGLLEWDKSWCWRRVDPFPDDYAVRVDVLARARMREDGRKHKQYVEWKRVRKMENRRSADA